MKQQNLNQPCLSFDTLCRAGRGIYVHFDELLTDYVDVTEDAVSKSEENWDELAALIDVLYHLYKYRPNLS